MARSKKEGKKIQMMEKKQIKYRPRRLAGALCAALLTAWVCAVPAWAAGEYLIPGGRTVGIQLETPGALVVGLAKEEGGSPAGAAGVQPGDLIVALDGQEILSAEDFSDAATLMDGSEIIVTVRRADDTLDIPVSPVETDAGWRLGVWLRDSISGIGTLTFIDPETGLYGALGHPINDMDTGVLMPLGSGAIMDAEVVGVRRGVSGIPGELCGSFAFEGSCGSILSNTPCGIFGFVDEFDPGEALPVASEEEIHTGEATILSNVQGTEVASYTIDIRQVWRGDTRTLCFTVTDPQLLELTGGVVQGMSGSPIIQDGKLIGAVTHVLVNDPTRGYGISIGQMLAAAENLSLEDAA